MRQLTASRCSPSFSPYIALQLIFTALMSINYSVLLHCTVHCNCLLPVASASRCSSLAQFAPFSASNTLGAPLSCEPRPLLYLCICVFADLYFCVRIFVFASFFCIKHSWEILCPVILSLMNIDAFRIFLVAFFSQLTLLLLSASQVDHCI